MEEQLMENDNLPASFSFIIGAVIIGAIVFAGLIITAFIIGSFILSTAA
jgi:hypothetical protein